MHLSRGKYIFNEFFLYFWFMPDTIDILSFLQRVNMTQAELSKALDTTPGNVNRWAKREGVPSFGLCKKLLELGMTPKELFGEEIDELIKAHYMNARDPQLPKMFDNKEFREGISLANSPKLRDEIIDLVKKLKSTGQV